MKKNIYKIITIITIIIVCILSAKKALQNDTLYTIKLGESILKNGIDFIDHFSWHSNLPYTYPHWLYNIIIYIIYSINGFKSLYIYNIISFITLAITFYFVNLKINKNEGVISTICILFGIMISAFIVVRAQTITYILFLLEILFIKLFLDSGKNRYGVCLLLIAILICNIHSAVYPLFFILFLPYIAEYIITKISFIYKWLNKKLSIKKEKHFSKLIILMILSLFAGLLTPTKAISYTYFIKIAQSGCQKFILEHQTGLKDPITSITLIIVLLLFIFFIFKSKEKVRIIDLFMILGLSIMVCLSARHFALYIILGLISFIGLLGNYIKEHEILNMIFNSKIFLFIVAIEMIFISTIMFNIEYKREYLDNSFYPINALNYLKNNYDLENKKIFNDFAFGSYLLFNDTNVFIDSRCDLYLKSFNKEKDYFYEYLAIRDANKELLDYYEFDFTLTYKNDLINQLIESYDNYENIYEDEYFIIYKKI